MIKNHKLKLLQSAIIGLEASFFGSKQGRLYRFIINETEKTLIQHILIKTEGNKLKAAKILGINRNTLHSKIKKLGISLK
jgi:DNA-binding protein Fis